VNLRSAWGIPKGRRKKWFASRPGDPREICIKCLAGMTDDATNKRETMGEHGVCSALMQLCLPRRIYSSSSTAADRHIYRFKVSIVKFVCYIIAACCFQFFSISSSSGCRSEALERGSRGRRCASRRSGRISGTPYTSRYASGSGRSTYKYSFRGVGAQ